MISRRNIRVKVMQQLYVLHNTQEDISIPKQIQILDKNFQKTRELIIYLLQTIVEVAQYAEIDAKNRANKNITTHADLTVNTKIAGNELLWQILENKSFSAAVEELKIEIPNDNEMIRKMYLQLIETEEYQYYIKEEGRDKKKEIDIMNYLFNHVILPNELFTATAEEKFSNWDDDIEMVQNIISIFFTKPSKLGMHQMLGEDKWNFAKNLLSTVIEKKEHLLTIITPKFKNWDPDRIALIDMILLQLGVAEFLYFETIPTRVTLNEYIDLAKEYSTPQSGQFINGLLDTLQKELAAEGKINKVQFKNSFL
ncbi:MAG: transcription antitermination factor NusB [Chitinophagaceae bacterium]